MCVHTILRARNKSHTWMPIVDDKDDPVAPRVVAGLVLEAGVKDQGLSVFPRSLLLPNPHPAILWYVYP